MPKRRKESETVPIGRKDEKFQGLILFLSLRRFNFTMY